jgi:hypothetical protein
MAPSCPNSRGGFAKSCLRNEALRASRSAQAGGVRPSINGDGSQSPDVPSEEDCGGPAGGGGAGGGRAHKSCQLSNRMEDGDTATPL